MCDLSGCWVIHVLFMLYILGNLDSSWTNWAISETLENSPWYIGILMTPVWDISHYQKNCRIFLPIFKKTQFLTTQTHKKIHIQGVTLPDSKCSKTQCIYSLWFDLACKRKLKWSTAHYETQISLFIFWFIGRCKLKCKHLGLTNPSWPQKQLQPWWHLGKLWYIET